jgi:signal transduction histidine kinase
VTLALLLRMAMSGPVHWTEFTGWLALALGTFAAGVGIGFLGARQRRYAAEQEFFANLTGLLQVEHGLAESIRSALQEVLQVFHCQLGVLAFLDHELNRIFVWKTRAGDETRITPESLPPEKADAFLLDAPDISICWNSLAGAGEGFGWNRHDGKRVSELPRLPGPSREALGAKSLLAVTLEMNEGGDARVLLLNSDQRFSAEDLQWLERMMRHLAPALRNVFLLRHMRARTIEAERNRISHDLHDGILQTMLSVDIQLEVMRRKLPHAADQVATQLAQLQQTIRGESTELRRMVNDLRPVHVESADLTELMRNFGERFRSENSVKLELLTETISVQVSERVCRELFQIYKEALHNIKKHSRASHVVVKLWQDEAKVCLVVDDNGQGFSFAGRFSSDELDRLRLGPISIKERTRSIGGVLTVESNPGHGARLTVEVPLN